MEEAAFHHVLRGALLTWEQRNKDSSGWAELSQISSAPEHLSPYDSPPWGRSLAGCSLFGGASSCWKGDASPTLLLSGTARHFGHRVGSVVKMWYQGKCGSEREILPGTSPSSVSFSLCIALCFI